MSSTKRELAEGDEPEPEPEPEPELEPEVKKAKVDDSMVLDTSGLSLQKQRVVLNTADCDLDFDIEENGLQGSGLHEGGFAYCWSGARANVGITGGKYCFGVKIVSTQPVIMEDTPPDQQHVCRVGISRGNDQVGNLGETEHSFGFGGTGKFSNAGKFLDFGEKFGVGDTVVCAVDLESKPLASVGFSKNGKWLGLAKQFDVGPMGLGVMDSALKEMQWESAVFPHILLKNVVVLMQFSIEEGLAPVKGYKPWVSAFDDGTLRLGPTFSNTEDCQVMLMVGLPASGKTTWAEKWLEDHPEKRYVLLGTNLILDQMKVPGLVRKHNYGERFERLMGRANVIFDTLLSRASRTPRNYIIDQTNVFKSARKRKLRPFANFRMIAVVVFPKPEELKIRSDKRFKEMGKEVPADAVNNMLANFVLPGRKDIPGSDEFFDQVMFVELDREEAQRYLNDMKRILASHSNPNLQTNYSCNSRESSVASFGPSLNNKGNLSEAVGIGRALPSLQLNYGYQMPNQVNSSYGGSNSEPYQGCQNLPMARAPAPYGTYQNNLSSSVPIDNRHYTANYGTSPGGGVDPYWGYGVGDPYSIPAYVVDPYRTSMVQSPPVRSARTSFMHNSFVGQFSPVRGPQVDLQAPRAPEVPPNPLPSAYGSPYHTPMTRPSYRNFPADMQHSRRNATPYPRHY